MLCLLVGHCKDHLTCKKSSDDVLVWLSRERERDASDYAHGPADATSTSLSHNSQLSRVSYLPGVGLPSLFLEIVG